MKIFYKACQTTLEEIYHKNAKQGTESQETHRPYMYSSKLRQAEGFST